MDREEDAKLISPDKQLFLVTNKSDNKVEAHKGKYIAKLFSIKPGKHARDMDKKMFKQYTDDQAMTWLLHKSIFMDSRVLWSMTKSHIEPRVHVFFQVITDTYRPCKFEWISGTHPDQRPADCLSRMVDHTEQHNAEDEKEVKILKLIQVQQVKKDFANATLAANNVNGATDLLNKLYEL